MNVDTREFQRHEMVEHQLRARGIKNSRVLQAMDEVPRERFVPEEISNRAYEDSALMVGMGQTISQPYMVASMTECLDPKPHHRVLEIGTGSGYQAAILSRLVEQVYTIERHDALQQNARSILEGIGYDNITYRIGDGTLGWPEQAPFNGILVTAGAPDIPQSLVDQLADGGRLVIPVGTSDQQTLTIVERYGEKTREMPQYACRFVKLIGREGWQEE